MTKTVKKISKHPKDFRELRRILDMLEMYGIKPKEYDLIPPFRRQIFPAAKKWKLD